MLTDIEIAQACKKQPIAEIAKAAHVDEKYLEQYGNYKAKIDYNFLKDNADKPDGKLILVTAITPTPAGAVYQNGAATSTGISGGVSGVAPAVQTGDDTPVLHLLIALLLAGIVIGGVVIYRLKKRG